MIMRRVKFKVVSINHTGVRNSLYAEGSYNLLYPKGAIVRARENTLGVAVFQTRQDALDFCSHRDFISSNMIIRVCPIGRGKNVNYVSRSTQYHNLDIFYAHVKGDTLEFGDTMRPPFGTIFYPAVEVLD